MPFEVKRMRAEFEYGVDVTRARTATAYHDVARLKSVPTPMLDLINALIQRIADLEDKAGYRPDDTPGLRDEVHFDKVDTQGR